MDGLQRTVNEIIREARRPASQGTRVACDATQVVAGRAAFWQPLADDQDRRLATKIAPGPVLVGVSRDDLAACTDILLENVFSHTPEGTAFSVRVSHRAGGGAWVVVSDGGPGFADPDAARRGRSSAGSTGLGLDIARRIAEASGGTLTVARSASGGGAVTAGFGPPGGPAADARRGRRVRPPLLRRRPGGEVPDQRDDPPPWAELADRGRRPPQR